MKLYELMRTIDPQEHDLEAYKWYFWDGTDCHDIPINFRTLARYADCEVVNTNLDFCDKNEAFVAITFQAKPEKWHDKHIPISKPHLLNF